MSIPPLKGALVPAVARDSGEEQVETMGGNTVMRYVPGPSDPTAMQSMRLVELSGTLDFWDKREEDIYSAEDGDPL